VPVDALVQEKHDGAVRTTLKAMPSSPTLGEAVQLHILADCPSEYTMTISPLPSDFEGFSLRFSEGGGGGGGARSYMERHYVLTPKRVGVITFPPIVVTYSKIGSSSAMEAQTDAFFIPILQAE
jgi:hypothetical protein